MLVGIKADLASKKALELTFEGFLVGYTEQFFDGPPLEKLAPSGGRERHAVRERGGHVLGCG